MWRDYRGSDRGSDRGYSVSGEYKWNRAGGRIQQGQEQSITYLQATTTHSLYCRQKGRRSPSSFYLASFLILSFLFLSHRRQFGPYYRDLISSCVHCIGSSSQHHLCAHLYLIILSHMGPPNPVSPNAAVLQQFPESRPTVSSHLSPTNPNNYGCEHMLR